METEDPLKDLIEASCTSREVDALGALEKELIPDRGALSIEDLEQEWLELASSTLGDDSNSNNPFPDKQPEKLLTNIENLKRFTSYLFERRYGWSEALNKENKLECSHGLGSQPTCPTSEEDVLLKGRLNDLLDDFLKWYFCQPVNPQLLESLKHTIVKASSFPVVRNQTFVHVMEWLKVNAHDSARISESFDLIKDIMVCGLTDIWSAIRNACVARLSPIIEHFKITQIEAFFQDLAKICLNKESTWQAIEGAVMGINSIIRRFQWIGCQPAEPSLSGSGTEKAEYYLKFGVEELTQLPIFISSQIHSVIFPLLGHPQLSIRENAIKAFSSFLSRCEFKEALSSFKEVISLLCTGAMSDPIPADGQIAIPSPRNNLPHLAVMKPDYKFLDAYHAEGLLGVCIFLVKHISPGYLLPHWPLYFSTFNLYLMHPASTVRQATSAVFKYLVAKDSNNPSLLKLVLQGLCAEWSVDMSLLTQHANYRSIHKSYISTEPQNPGVEHEEKTFPITRPRVPSTESYDRVFDGESHTSRSGMLHPRQRRLSINMVHTAGCGDQFYISADSIISKAWEWREGRLFAYELIIKFLIINHIHYLFPSYALPPHKFDGMASTDDTLTTSHQSRVLDSKGQVKSQSHGGSTLHKIFHNPGLTKKHSVDETKLSSDDKERSSSAGKERKQGGTSQSSPGEKEKVLTRACSERRKETTTNIPEDLQKKRAMTQVDVTAQANPQNAIKKHYTYFTKQEKQKISPRLKFLATATSLLNQTKQMDGTQAWKVCQGAGDLMCLHSPVKITDHKPNEEFSNDSELLKSCLCPATSDSLDDVVVPDWIHGVQCENMAGILRLLLLQTIECLADTRWELRRMGQQTLPLITECIRWYDMQILKSLWDTHLVNETTLICYGVCIALKFSINHAIRLVHFLEQPPASWKDPGACREIALSIVDVIRTGLPTWMKSVHQIIHRPNFDKLTVVAMEIVMLAHSCFPHCVPEKLFEERTILNLFKKLFVHAHREYPLAEELKMDVDTQPLQTPLDGYLNCCTRDEISTSYPQLVEKYAVTETHPWMPHFFRSCELEHVISVLPIMVYHIGYYSEISDMYRALLEGIHCLLTMTGEYLHKHCLMKPEGEMAKVYDQAMGEMCHLITLKTLELSVARQLLDLFVIVCEYVTGTAHLSRVFEAITTRLDLFFALGDDPSPNRTDSEAHGMSSSNLALLSNDIPASPVEATEDISDDEDEHKEHSHIIKESLVLNTSNSSSQAGGMRSSTPEGRVVSPAIDDIGSESGSDWDSWDDDEEDQTGLTGIFAEFLSKLQVVYSETPTGGKHSEFHEELIKSGASERKLINSLLDKV
ncbi:uncharacterized protein [Ptychodera flava]|uniref:uncharacterized protein isoform X2 n=1 Tax=Ptychodera flava TaxID=63121 RepID=UPI00396A8801